MISYRDASRKRGELLTLDLYLFNNIRLAECCCCCCGANCPNFREYPALHCQLCRSSPHSHFFIASSLSLLPKQRSRFPQSCLPVLTSQSKGVSAELHELLLRKLSCGEPKSADRKLLQQWKSKRYLLWSQNPFTSVTKYLWPRWPIHGKIICSTVSTSQVFPGVGRR